MATVGRFRSCAFRMRVSMSPSGSFINISNSSPARLHHAGDFSVVAHRAKRNAAHPELAVDPARPAGDLAAIAHAIRRRVARQLGELQPRREALLVAQVRVDRGRLQLRALGARTASPAASACCSSRSRSSSPSLKPLVVRSLPEREVHGAEQRPRLFVGLRRGAHHHVHPPDLIDLVVVDLREDDVLLDAERDSCRARRSSSGSGRGSRARAAAPP